MKSLYTLVLTSLIFSSCTPLMVVRLEPEGEPDRMLYGAPILSEATEEALVEVNFYDATQEYIVFDLQIQNTSKEAFDFDPATCLLVPNVGPVTQAIDPELELFSLDMETVRQQKNQRTMAWVGGALLVAGTVAAVTSDFGGGGELVEAPVNNFGGAFAIDLSETILFTVLDVNDAINRRERLFEDAAIPPPDNRYFWLDHSLRVTTLRPGETAFGKVVFPRNDEAATFAFKVKIGERELDFPFVQRQFRP